MSFQLYARRPGQYGFWLAPKARFKVMLNLWALKDKGCCKPERCNFENSFNCHWSKVEANTILNVIYDFVFEICFCSFQTVMTLWLYRHSEKSQMITVTTQVLQYIATWVPVGAPMSQRTFHLQFIIKQILCENVLLNNAHIFDILSTGIPSYIQTIVHWRRHFAILFLTT